MLLGCKLEGLGGVIAAVAGCTIKLEAVLSERARETKAILHVFRV